MAIWHSFQLFAPLGIVETAACMCTMLVLATIPYLEPAGFIDLCGNGLTTSKIKDFQSELPN
jgi:hypothetical protein